MFVIMIYRVVCVKRMDALDELISYHDELFFCWFFVCLTQQILILDHPESVCVCVSLASDSSETIEVLIIKLGTVTASDTRLHHVLIIFTLTFTQGHTDLNHENIKCFIISETVQTMPINFAVKITRLKVYIIFSQSDDLALHSRL